MAWSKLSRQARGYGAEWDRARKEIIARDMGLCQPCLKQGRTTKYHAVDHIVSKEIAKARGWSKERTEHPDNLQCICKPCHLVKTEEEQGKTKRPQPKRIGVDGFPIEDKT